MKTNRIIPMPISFSITLKLLVILISPLLMTSCGDNDDNSSTIEITSIEPLRGEKYTQVTITGSGELPKLNNFQILFNGVETRDFVYKYDGVNFEIIAEVPRKASTGLLTLDLGEQVIEGEIFTYLIGDIEIPFSGNVCDIYGPSSASAQDEANYEYESNHEYDVYSWEILEGDMEIIGATDTEFAAVKFGDNFNGGFLRALGTGDEVCSEVLEITLN